MAGNSDEWLNKLLHRGKEKKKNWNLTAFDHITDVIEARSANTTIIKHGNLHADSEIFPQK